MIYDKIESQVNTTRSRKRTFCSVQFSHSIMSNSLRPHGLQNTRFPCLSPTPRAYSNSFSIKLVMPCNHLILCRPLLLLLSFFSSTKVFSNESVLHIRWPNNWRFSFSISSSSEQSGLISFRMDCWISLQSKGLSRVFSNTTVQHQFFGIQLSLCPTLTSIHDYWKNHSLTRWIFVGK